jgi:uncharacterized membrane protein
LPLLAFAVLVTGSWINPFRLGLNFWLPVVGIALGFYPLNTFLYLNALKVGKLSDLVPLQTVFGRPLTILTAYIFLNQTASWHAGIFFLLSFLGVYFLFQKGTLRESLRHKSAVYSIYGSVLGCIVGILDVVAIRAANPVYFTFVTTVAGATVLALTARHRNKQLLQPVALCHLRQISYTAVIFAGSYLAYVYALSLGNLAHVNTVRTSALILGGLFTGRHIGELITIRKLIGITLILASVCGLAFS